MSTCSTCNKILPHDWIHEENLDCVPPEHQLQYGEYFLDAEYKADLYVNYPFYTTEEIVGTYLGFNIYFLSQEAWWDEKNIEYVTSDSFSRDSEYASVYSSE